MKRKILIAVTAAICVIVLSMIIGNIISQPEPAEIIANPYNTVLD